MRFLASRFFSSGNVSVIERECESFAPANGNLSMSLLEARRRYRWFQKWTEVLTRLRQDFHGDLDQYLMVLVFKQDEMAATLSALANPRGAVSLDRDPRGMNAMSVAEICGIPRETARRKLKLLVERKIIGIGVDGLYYLAPATSEAKAIEEMAALYAPVKPVSAAAATPSE